LADYGIETRGLRRRYKSRTGPIEALRGVDLQVEQGEVVGLLGPNGAGKTTLIRILSTTLLPTLGEAFVAGYSVRVNVADVRRNIGVVFAGSAGLFPKLSAADNLRYFAVLAGIPRREVGRRVDAALDEQGLLQRARTPVAEYSHGMRQRLHIARALLHDPPVLLLDEPTIGLDPVAGRQLRLAIRELRGTGKAILFCTHYMYEAEEVCDRLLVMKGGQILAEGTSSELAARATGVGVVELTSPLALRPSVDELRALAEVTAAAEVVGPTECRIDLHTRNTALLTQALEGVLPLATEPTMTLRIRTPSLEDVYVELIGGGGDV
jgi:ABC-2 type transport system ATP-binding protein